MKVVKYINRFLILAVNMCIDKYEYDCVCWIIDLGKIVNGRKTHRMLLHCHLTFRIESFTDEIPKYQVDNDR